MIFYNINYYKGSYGRPESHISLILDYRSAHAQCGLVAFHNYKSFVWSVYMVISDTSCMIGGFTIALLTAEFEQVWAKLGLENRIQL